jgi:hypothetical protein
VGELRLTELSHWVEEDVTVALDRRLGIGRGGGYNRLGTREGGGARPGILGGGMPCWARGIYLYVS